MSKNLKNSGIEYLGLIGNDFEVKPINSLFSIKKDIIGHEPEIVLSITQNGIKPKNIESNEGQIAASYANYQIVNIGDFAMNHMDLITGGVDISKYEGVTSPDYRVFVLKDRNMIDRYFLYVFQLYYKAKTFFGFGQGVANLGRWRLPASNFKNIYLPIPSAKQQSYIVEILDKKCFEIDTLITNQQKQIEKLKQYKLALITEVVTRGVKPYGGVKDTNIEWIGKIPENWNVVPLTKQLTSIVDYRGKTPEKVNDGIFLVTAKNIKDGKIDYEISKEYVRSDEYEEIMHRGIPDIGDVLFTTEAPLGQVANIDKTDIALAQRIIKFKPKCNLNSYFLKYWIMSSGFQNFLSSLATGSTASGIKASKLVLLPLVLPSVDEQKDIVSFLDIQNAKIESLIAIKQKKIEKLQQYKKSIIYEYVTGKKEAL